MTYRVNTSQRQLNDQQLALAPNRAVLRVLLILLVMQSCVAALFLSTRQSDLDKLQHFADDCRTSLSSHTNMPESFISDCRDDSAQAEQKV